MSSLITGTCHTPGNPSEVSARLGTLANPILNGPLLKTGVRLALPLVATGFLSSVIGIADMCLAGFIGPEAQAGVGIADQVLFMTLLLGTGLCTGIVACVARSVGAGDYDLARRYARDGLLLAVAIGLAATVIGVCAATPLLQLFHCSGGVMANALPYLQYCSMANAPWLVALCQSAIFRAVGKTHYCLLLWTWMAFISIAGSFCLFFIPGAPGFHSLSALGYAWIGGALCGIILGVFLGRRIDWRGSSDANCPGDGHTQRVQELLRIAAPAVLAEMLWILSNFGMYRLLADLPHSCDVQAAWSINLKLEETIASVPLLGLAMAAATIAGQSTGAAKFGRARAGGWQLAALGMVFMLAAGTLLQAQSFSLGKMLSDSDAIASNVSLLLNGSSIALPFLSLWLVLTGGLEGAGLTKLSLALNFVGLLLVRIPLAWILAHVCQLGLMGVWISVVVSRMVMGAFSAFAFARFLHSKWCLTEQR